MELARLRPYKIKSLSAIFHLQMRHVMFYVLRANFTRHQYYSGRVKFAFHYGFWLTVNYWLICAIVISIFLKATSFFDMFIFNYSQIMKIKDYETFVLTEIVGFVAAEKFWIDNFRELRKRRHGQVDVAFELSTRHEKDLSRDERLMLIDFFIRMSFLSGISYKISSYGLLPLVIQLNYMTVLEFIANKINLIQFVVYVWLTIAINLYAVSIMSLMFVNMPHHFFMLRILRIKLSHCLRFMHYAHTFTNRTFLARFECEYNRLHRLIQLYNRALRDQIAMHDTVFKMAGLVSFIFYLKQKERLNMFGYMIIVMYCFMYGIYLFVESRLGDFPKQNLVCYRQLLSLSARSQWRSSNRTRSNKVWRASSLIVMSHEFRHCLRMNKLTDLLSNNRFGFTYATRYIITNMKILQSIMTNFYVMALLFKKLKVD